MLTFPAPANVNGDALLTELRAAGLEVPDYPGIRVDPLANELHVHTDAPRASVQKVIDAHVPPPPPADPVEEFRKAVEASTSLAGLKAALLGTTGPGAEPRAR